MTSRWGGAVTVTVAAAVSMCGLFMIGGTAPSAGIRPADDATIGDTIAYATSVPVATTIPTTSDPAPGSTATTTATTTTTTTRPTTTTTVTTTTAATTTTAPTGTAPTTTSTVPPEPPAVTASGTIVGVGGTVTFRGSCDETAGPVAVTVAVTREADGRSEVVDTGLTTSPWTYTWSAPTDERDASSFVFRFWCAPGGGTGDAPSVGEARVDMVASAAPPARPAPVPRVVAPDDQTLPKTN